MIKETDRISQMTFKQRSTEIEGNSWMLVEDLSANVVPLYRRKDEKITCQLSPHNEELAEILMNLIPSRNSFERNNLEDAIMGCIDFIAGHIAHQGFLVLEFVTSKDYNEQLSYNLVSVYGEKVKVKRKNIVQMIEVDQINDDEAERRSQNLKKIKIPRTKCFVISFPPTLGGTSRYNKFIRNFRLFGKKEPYMNFFNNPLKDVSGYDIQLHQRLHSLQLWKLSKWIGWHHRGNSDKIISGYYQYYRYLQFSKTKIILRDHIIEQLKIIITSISEILNIPSSDLQITGLLTLSEVEKQIKLWELGQIDVKKAGDFI